MREYYPEAATEIDARPKSGLGLLLNRFLMRDQVRFVHEALSEAPWQGPVLDVACGAGLFLRELNLPQHRLAGMDFSVGAAAAAWNNNGVPAVCGALPSAPFRERVFVVITMFQVLEHLYDPVVYIETAVRLLCPGGRLIVQVPNADSWQFLMFGERWSGLDIPRHLLHFHERDLRNLLEFCGFEIVRTKRFSLRDCPRMLAASIAPGLDPRLRRVREIEENRAGSILKTTIFVLLWLIAVPLAAIESVCRGGATLTIDARLKS
jgi:SAM-dependent methyltransferase